MKPFKISVIGKPCSGKSYYSAQLAKHYGVPHIHKEQVLTDIQNWNSEKEAEYKHRQDEKIRLANLAEERAEEAKRAEEEAARIKADREAAEKARIAAELGSDPGANSEEEVSEAPPAPTSPKANEEGVELES